MATDKNFAVGLNGSGENTVGHRVAIAEIEIEQRLIEPAVGFQPRDVVARHRPWRVEETEIAPEQNLAIWLHRDRKNKVVCAGVQRISQAGYGIEPGDAVAPLS